MNNQSGKKGQMKGRTLISLFTTWMFFVLAITGLVLFIVPQGRIAYWVDWRLLGLSKTDWGNIHIVASILFIVVGVWHLVYNWRAFLGHLRKKIAEGFQLRRELFVTATLTLLLAAGALWKIPPVGYLIDLNDAIKESWIESEDYEPPFGHAELLSLKALCKKTNIDLDTARAELDKKGFVVQSSEETLESIAANNQVSPKDVFAVFGHLRRTPVFDNKTGGGLTADQVFELFEGTGIGRMTVPDACERGGDRLSACMARLKNHGIVPADGDSIKDLAEKKGLQPIKVLQTMLAD